MTAFRRPVLEELRFKDGDVGVLPAETRLRVERVERKSVRREVMSRIVD
jgi:hypothetical protein